MAATVLLGLVAIAVPIVVGVTMKAEAAAGLLMTGTITGILITTLMNNAGGAWDNAKKFICCTVHLEGLS